MENLTDLGARVCGQQRCFFVGGVSLPVCQRCLGLYSGAALTWGGLLLGNVWRRPLPPRPVVALQAAALIAALLGGLHVIDGGPAWRLLCGLWTGHVVVVWLVGGARQLSAAGDARPALGWSRRASIVLAMSPVALAAVAWGFAAWGRVGLHLWYLWTGIALLGVLSLAFSAALALAAIARWLGRQVRRRRGRCG